MLAMVEEWWRDLLSPGVNDIERGRDPEKDRIRLREGELTETRVEQGVRTYGHSGTIHRTEVLNVETDKSGNVVAVWFRCQALPFDQTTVDGQRAKSMAGMTVPRLVAVEVIDS